MNQEQSAINELKFVYLCCMRVSSSKDVDPVSVLVLRDRAVHIIDFFESKPYIKLCEEGENWVNSIKLFLASFSFVS